MTGAAGRIRRIVLAAALFWPALAMPALAQDRPSPIVPIGGLDGLVPLDPLTLGSMRGGQLTRPQTTTPNPSTGVRLWDEIARPARPPLPQDGSVSSISRAMK